MLQPRFRLFLPEEGKKPTELKARLKSYLGCSFHPLSVKMIIPIQVCCLSFVTTEFLISFPDCFGDFFKSFNYPS